MNREQEIEDIQKRLQDNNIDVENEYIDSIIEFVSDSIVKAFETKSPFLMKGLGSFRIKKNREYLFNLTQELKAKGYSNEEIQKIAKEHIKNNK